MKKILLLFIISILCFSCKKVKKDEKYKPKTRSELYEEAKNMKCIGELIIGKTTIADLDLINNEIKRDKRYKSSAKRGFEPNKLRFQIDCLTIFFNDEYYIGDIKISSVYLYFFDGILYKIKCNISEFPETDEEGVIKSGFFIVDESDETDISLFNNDFSVINNVDSVRNAINKCRHEVKQQKKKQGIKNEVIN